jgi:hypothetical protein
MPIAMFLGGQKFDAETTRVMGVAYEMVHATLVRDWGDIADQIIARKVIDRICEQVLVYLNVYR